MPHLRFPLWIVHSGLPRHLAEAAKTPLAWGLFRAIVELDLAQPEREGIVEATYEQISELTGIPAAQVPKLARKLRKAGVVRSFLPEDDDDPALFQVIRPLATPIPWTEVREAVPALRNEPDHAFAYATESPEMAMEGQVRESRYREVIDLYLNTVSMKLNDFIADELRLIAARYDIALIRKVFAQARKRESQSLAWISAAIQKERRGGQQEKTTGENPVRGGGDPGGPPYSP